MVKNQLSEIEIHRKLTKIVTELENYAEIGRRMLFGLVFVGVALCMGAGFGSTEVTLLMKVGAEVSIGISIWIFWRITRQSKTYSGMTGEQMPVITMISLIAWMLITAALGTGALVWHF